MPANYAHYRFGKLVLPKLPADVRQCIQRFRRMFDMGLHGPDFFFYYNPFLKTAVGDLGGQYHRKTGLEFFPAACACADTEAAKAYLYGLLGHYCLDSLCHPYVNRIEGIGEATHVELESQFEHYLLTLDGEAAPETYDMSRRFHLTRGECMTVAEFYPPATGANVSRSVRSMAFSVKFLANPKHEALLRKVKPELCQQMIPAQEREDLAVYIRELKALFDQALEHYPKLLSQLTAHMQTGEPLGELFTENFG